MGEGERKGRAVVRDGGVREGQWGWGGGRGEEEIVKRRKRGARRVRLGGKNEVESEPSKPNTNPSSDLRSALGSGEEMWPQCKGPAQTSL